MFYLAFFWKNSCCFTANVIWYYATMIIETKNFISRVFDSRLEKAIILHHFVVRLTSMHRFAARRELAGLGCSIN